MKSPEIKFEDIGPELAAEYLLANRKNRPPKKAAIEMYARDMQAGNWRVTHQGIAFDENGDLIDGQNRLHAIVKSGSTVKMLVTRGLPVEQRKKKTMDAVDQGVPRSVADQLRLSHDATGRVSLLVATSARIVALVFGNEVKKLSTPQCVDMQALYGAAIDAVLVSMERAMIKPLLRAPVLGGLAFARAAYPEHVDRFMDELVKEKSDVDCNHPARVLHNEIWQQSLDKANPYGSGDRRLESERVLRACQKFIAPADETDALTFFSGKQTELIDGLKEIFFAEPLKKKVIQRPTPPPRLVASAGIQISAADADRPAPTKPVTEDPERRAWREYRDASENPFMTDEKVARYLERWQQAIRDKINA